MTRLFILALLTMPLKAWALWRAARDDKKGWFIGICLFNTFGILEVIYIFFVSEATKKK